MNLLEFLKNDIDKINFDGILINNSISKLIFKKIINTSNQSYIKKGNIFYKPCNNSSTKNILIITKNISTFNYYRNKYQYINFVIYYPNLNKNYTLKKNTNNINSFYIDIFDTLILERFPIYKDRLNFLSYFVFNQMNTKFIQLRNKVELTYTEDDKFHSNSCMYEKINKNLNKLKNSKKINHKIEFNILNRLKFYNYYVIKYLNKSNAQINLISDTGFSRGEIIKLLDNSELKYDQMYISSELKKTKFSGSMYEFLKKQKNLSKSVVIGNNEISDNIMPKLNNIKSLRIEEWQNLLFKKIDFIKSDATAHELFNYSFLAQHIINDLYDETKIKIKKINFDSKIFGIYFFGPLIFNYFEWLTLNLKKNKLHKIYFLSREGFYIKKLYDFYLKKTNQKIDTEYLLISRKPALQFIISRRKKFDNHFDIHRYEGNLKYLMKARFDIKINSKKDFLIDTRYDDVSKLIKPYENEILEKANEQTKRYKKFLKLRYNVSEGKKIAISDMGVYGTAQYGLEQLLGKSNVYGFYLCSDSKSNPYNLKYKYGYLNSKSSFLSISHIFESIFTSPNGSFIGLDNTLRVKYSKKTINQSKQAQDIRKEIVNGVQMYLDTIFYNINYFRKNKIRKNFLENNFLNLKENNFILDKQIKDLLYFENLMVRSNVHKIN